MTAMPEAALAKELGLSYASCSVVANWAAGKSPHEITMTDIHQNLVVGMENLRKLLKVLDC
jgi:5'-methylthioinosine phosphorylase